MMYDIVKPKRLDFDKKSKSGFYASFSAGPFERGYGVTVGNYLRRMLLSSIEGAAIVGVKFNGVFHEFSSLPGVMEDVIEIILNLKLMKVKLAEGINSKRLYLKKDGAGKVVASDFTEDADVEILNPDHLVVTIDGSGKIDMEVIIVRGRGYVPADKQDLSEESVQMIPVDAIFSPIEKVNYHIEKTRVVD